MREKTLKFLSTILFDDHADASTRRMVTQFREQLESGFGELPPKALEALAAVERAHTERREGLRAKVAEVYEQHFNEQEMDEIITFYQGPIGKYLTIGISLQDPINKIMDESSNDALHSIETELAALLGEAGMPEGGTLTADLAPGGSSPFKAFVEKRAAQAASGEVPTEVPSTEAPVETPAPANDPAPAAPLEAPVDAPTEAPSAA